MIEDDERLAQPGHDDLEGIPGPAESGPPIGHDEAWAAMQAAYRRSRLPHGLILSGPAGIGKATFAYQFARYVLAHPKPDAAPEAGPKFPVPESLFRQVASGAHPGLLHLTRPFNARSKTFRTRITAEEVRAVGRFLSHTSGDGGYRIIIVDPAEDMNIHAANALLKILEEPPKNTLFMLTSHAPGRLLPTIRSRCQIQRLSPLPSPDLQAVLDRLGVQRPPDADMRRIAELTEGSVRRAILLLAFGGLEIVEAVDGVLAGAPFDLATARATAAAVGGRGGDDAFDQFNRHVDDRVTALANERAVTGEAEVANLDFRLPPDAERERRGRADVQSRPSPPCGEDAARTARPASRPLSRNPAARLSSSAAMYYLTRADDRHGNRERE